jgi:predicted lipoprotein with Yx(FWY)xxD motif
VKRILILLAGLTMLALPTSALAKSAPTVKLANTDKGKILVVGSPGSAQGFTLYMFTKDGRNKDNCAKDSNCISIWPPLTVNGKPTAGPGVRASLLGTIKLPNGSKQVTYAGHPLYTYSQDAGPGETSYIGAFQFGGTWYGVNPTGKKVK